MNAKEMFEKLGYEQRKHEHYIKYVKKPFISDWFVILFDLKEQVFSSIITTDSPFTPDVPLELNIEELKAINKQVEELGW